MAGYLGFALIHLHHDKLIHGVTFFILTVEVYFLFDTKNKSLRTLKLITFLTCTIAGSIVLEIIQNLINPSRIFDVFDIAFNMIGSLCGLILCIVIQSRIIKRSKQFRHRRLNRIVNEEDIETPGPSGGHDGDVGRDIRSSSDNENYVNIKMQDFNINSVD